jgi:integrase
MILLAFRHGPRAIELVDLEWSQVDFKAAVLHVRRAKKGTPATHPLRGDEMRALSKLQRESAASSFVFVSERGSLTAGFAKMVERVGAAAGLDFKAHAHMLRHACGFALANAGHDTRALQAYLVTATFSIRCAILSWRRTGSRIFGDDGGLAQQAYGASPPLDGHAEAVIAEAA